MSSHCFRQSAASDTASGTECNNGATSARRYRGESSFTPPKRKPSSIIRRVPNLQRINHNGRLAAIVLAGQAIIDDTLSDDDFKHVQAKCLYALELADDGRTDSYTDQDGDAYARAALRTG